MFSDHLEAIKTHLTTAGAKRVDYWKGQTDMGQNDPIMPAVFVDFGTIQWTNLGNGAKQGTALLAFHIVDQTVQETRSKAFKPTDTKLKRFDWLDTAVKALEGYSAKNGCGLILFNKLKLVSTTLDSVPGQLYDDIAIFQCIIYYYGTDQRNTWQEITLEGVETERDDTLEVSQ